MDFPLYFINVGHHLIFFILNGDCQVFITEYSLKLVKFSNIRM
jgi:hypothetical protein